MKRAEHFVVCVSLPYISVIVPFSPGAQRIPNQAFQAGADRGAREPGTLSNPLLGQQATQKKVYFVENIYCSTTLKSFKVVSFDGIFALKLFIL